MLLTDHVTCRVKCEVKRKQFTNRFRLWESSSNKTEVKRVLKAGQLFLFYHVRNERFKFYRKFFKGAILILYISPGRRKSRKTIPNVGSEVSGIWYLVSGIWYLVSGIWYLVSGIWYLVSGIWYLGVSSPLRRLTCNDTQQVAVSSLAGARGQSQILHQTVNDLIDAWGIY